MGIPIRLSWLEKCRSFLVKAGFYAVREVLFQKPDSAHNNLRICCDNFTKFIHTHTVKNIWLMYMQLLLHTYIHITNVPDILNPCIFQCISLCINCKINRSVYDFKWQIFAMMIQYRSLLRLGWTQVKLKITTMLLLASIQHTMMEK